MAYTPPNPNGQTTKANSAPVTLASDQNNALETGGNLAAIKADVDKIPSQGQALAAASMPVVLPAAQITTLTPPTTVTSNQGTAAAITGGWPTISGETADTTGTFTNATQTTSVTASSLTGYETATVSINGTYGTATAVFEGSDDAGTTWYSIPLARTDSATIEYGYTSLTNTNRMWTGQVTGLDSFRVRSTAVASGTVNVRISISAAATSDSSVVQLGSALPAGSAVIGHVIADSGSTTAVTQATAANLNAQVVGNVASGSSASGNPVQTGGLAKTALPTAVSDGQVVEDMHDKFGRQVTLPTTTRDLIGTQTTTLSATTSETTIVTAAASTFNDIMLLIVSNTSASTTTRIDFRDTTGGSVLFSLFSPAGDTRGFNIGGVAIPQTTVNTNWTAQCATSTTDIRIYAVYAKNK